MMSTHSPFRIGIIGGMGPLASVRLQELIVEHTPASSDQDHLQVLCFTNPHIPDRTEAWKTTRGTAACIAAIRATAEVLVQAGVDILVMPCHTAHVHFNTIQRGIPVPFLNMIDLTLNRLRKTTAPNDHVGFLGSDGSRNAGLYHRQAPDISWILPSDEEQRNVVRAMYTIKAGNLEAGYEYLLDVVSRLRGSGATQLLLGCTELSLCATRLRADGIPCVDPLELVAHALVARSQRVIPEAVRKTEVHTPP